ncbi:MAG TPA: hypothetical protein VEC06_07215 [Paucimonas sp.]|nr:hypothetical protein [Paucimonas sp.]
MTSRALLVKLSRLGAAGVLAALVLVAAAVGWIYHAISIEETPTCINFKASGTVDARSKVLADLQLAVESAGMVLEAERDMSKVWQSAKASVSYYGNRDSGEYSIFVCQEQRTGTLWQDIAKRVEQLLQGGAVIVWLQRNNRDFKCDPNCTVPLTVPIDFERLNRTVLADTSDS